MPGNTFWYWMKKSNQKEQVESVQISRRPMGLLFELIDGISANSTLVFQKLFCCNLHWSHKWSGMSLWCTNEISVEFINSPPCAFIRISLFSLFMISVEPKRKRASVNWNNLIYPKATPLFHRPFCRRWWCTKGLEIKVYICCTSGEKLVRNLWNFPNSTERFYR